MNYNIKYIFGEKSSFYKANLHSRSSLSDGSLSPEELKNIYKENGYFRLQPENPFMEPIYTQELTILGKVVGVIRNRV